MKIFKGFLIVGLIYLGLGIAYANASVIKWNTWTSASTGTLDSINVSFSAGGSPVNFVSNYPSYNPDSTFADGSIVDNAPVSTNNILRIYGGNTNVNTITFSTEVVDPVMAIWSLGQPGILANFSFIDATPTFVSGGPSAEYNGQAITITDDVVYGREGNGTVQFLGAFTSLSWQNTVYENWYGFNVGIPDTDLPPVPEPSTFLLLGVGLAGLVIWRKKRL